MTPEKLDTAIYEAKRFLEKADVASKGRKKMPGQTYEYLESGMANSACKRASLDLSRALSELRRS